jgi:hypothetical protein
VKRRSGYSLNDEKVVLSESSKLPARAAIWTVGMLASPLTAELRSATALAVQRLMPISAWSVFRTCSPSATPRTSSPSRVLAGELFELSAAPFDPGLHAVVSTG